MTILATPVGATGPVWTSEALQATLLVLVAGGSTLIAICRVPVRQVVFLSLYGILLSLLFFVLQAPDVTLSEITVGAVLLPLLLLLTLAKLKADGRARAGGESSDGGSSAARPQDRAPRGSPR